MKAFYYEAKASNCSAICSMFYHLYSSAQAMLVTNEDADFPEDGSLVYIVDLCCGCAACKAESPESGWPQVLCDAVEHFCRESDETQGVFVGHDRW